MPDTPSTEQIGELLADPSTRAELFKAPVRSMHPATAAAKLDELLKNSDWQQRYLRGDGPQVREYSELSTKKAEADADRLDKIVAGVAETPFMETVGRGQISTLDAMRTAEQLRGFGLNDDSIKQAISGKPVSKQEFDAVHTLRGDRMADRDWGAKVLANNPAAVREFTLMNLIVANGFREEGKSS